MNGKLKGIKGKLSDLSGKTTNKRLKESIDKKLKNLDGNKIVTK